MRLTQVTPFIPCTSLEKQVAFYRDVLGFEVGHLAEGIYAFLRRDDVAIRLVQVSDDVDLHHPERQGSFYIDVQDIDAVWAEIQPRLSGLPESRVRKLFNQDYSQREFHVADEDCTLVFFGEGIQASG